MGTGDRVVVRGVWVGSSRHPAWLEGRPGTRRGLQLWLRRPAAQGQGPLRALPARAPARFPKSQTPMLLVSGLPPQGLWDEMVGRGICGGAAQGVSVRARGSSGEP